MSFAWWLARSAQLDSLLDRVKREAHIHKVPGVWSTHERITTTIAQKRERKPMISISSSIDEASQSSELLN